MIHLILVLAFQYVLSCPAFYHTNRCIILVRFMIHMLCRFTRHYTAVQRPCRHCGGVTQPALAESPDSRLYFCCIKGELRKGESSAWEP